MFTKKGGDAAVLAKLGDAPAQYGEIGQRLHRIIRESAPSLEPIVRWGRHGEIAPVGAIWRGDAR
jgi:hypothetical protein